ncbi:MAG: Maf family protein [Vicinamibacterales bacterium]
MGQTSGAAAKGQSCRTILLASASPRRAELLAKAGFEFDVAPAVIDETPRPGERPTDYVLRVAAEKAMAAATSRPLDHRPVLAADTAVVVHGELLGKPVDAQDAHRMLQLLSDAVHEVHTGVVLLLSSVRAPDGSISRIDEVATTRVRFAAMTPQEIAWYVATGEPDGKAGAYAIQGRASRFIEWIDGSWSNVVGLPVATVYRMLRRADMVS